MKLPWKKLRYGKAKGKEVEQHSTASVVSASLLGILRVPGRGLKNVFSKRKQGLHEQTDQSSVEELLRTCRSLRSSSNDVPIAQSTNSCNFGLPLDESFNVKEFVEPEMSSTGTNQNDPYEPNAKPNVEADDSTLGTTIVLPENSAIDPEVSSTVGLLNGKDSQLLNDRPHPTKRLSVTNPTTSRDILDTVNVFGKNPERPGGERTVIEQDRNRGEFFVHDDNAKSSRSQTQEELAASDVALTLQHLSNNFETGNVHDDEVRKHQIIFEANKDVFQQRWTSLSDETEGTVDQWSIMSQMPQIESDHPRLLSGTTLVDSDDSRNKSSTSQSDPTCDIGLAPKRSSQEDRSEYIVREDAQGIHARISIDAISPDVGWEVVLDSQQISHENEMADLAEDHAAEIDEIRAEYTVQIRQIRKRYASALTAIKRLGGHNKQLSEQQDFQAQQLLHKDGVIEQVVASYQGLQSRFEQLEASLISKEPSESSSTTSSNVSNHAILEQIAVLKAEAEDKDQKVYRLQDANAGLLVALAKDKLEADFNADRVHELMYRLGDKPPSESEKDRIIECKDKSYNDLHDQSSEIIEGLRARVRTLEKEAEVEKASSNGQILVLKSKLQRKIRLNSDLVARKNAFQSANKSIFDLRMRPADDADLQDAMDECFQAVQNDNTFLKETVKHQAEAIEKAAIETTSMQAIILGSRTTERDQTKVILDLKEQKHSQECEMGRLQAEVEIMPVQHKEVLAAKDAWIAHYKDKAISTEHEKDVFINSRLDLWVREAFNCKQQELSQLRSDIAAHSSANQKLRNDLAKLESIRAEDAGLAFIDTQASEMNRKRARIAEEEVWTLREELSDLRIYQRNEWALAIKAVGCDLLDHIKCLEKTLQAHGIRNGDHQHDLIARYISLLNLVEDHGSDPEAKSHEVENSEAQRSVPSNEQILAGFDEVLVDEGSRSRHVDMPAQETGETITLAQKAKSVEMTSSAWARKYAHADQAGPSDHDEDLFF